MWSKGCVERWAESWDERWSDGRWQNVYIFWISGLMVLLKYVIMELNFFTARGCRREGIPDILSALGGLDGSGS